MRLALLALLLVGCAPVHSREQPAVVCEHDTPWELERVGATLEDPLRASFVAWCREFDTPTEAYPWHLYSGCKELLASPHCENCATIDAVIKKATIETDKKLGLHR